jgi:glutamine amidotransferase
VTHRDRRLRLRQSAFGGEGVSSARAREGGGEKIEVSNDPDAVRRADRVVLPGVAAFADCRRGLDAVPGMIDALNETVARQGHAFFRHLLSACN